MKRFKLTMDDGRIFIVKADEMMNPGGMFLFKNKDGSPPEVVDEDGQKIVPEKKYS